ncbi:glycosyltransferase family 1 protein [Pontibacter toksunensis]|uniref:Glycosyltransferase family 1 protein n=1 Tax=Pontibacter toksunensis TaxID=1332631 RepID=A0ABW6BUR8_9BACT
MFKTNTTNPVPVNPGENWTDTETNAPAEKRKASSITTETESFLKNLPDVVCLSHLRWDFVYQRPQHLLSRFAKYGRVYFVEEPIFDDSHASRLNVSAREENLYVVVPNLPHRLTAEQIEEEQRTLLNSLLKEQLLERFILWYYTPMALGFSSHLSPALTIYDCMDELSAFKFSPPLLKELEQELFKRADLVFTGGQSLYDSKKKQHMQTHLFPSSIDKAHFAKAKEQLEQPADQAAIPAPRIGFFGVIDERMDLQLIAAVADKRPDWQIVMLGPVVKIDPADLPKRENIQYLGGKSYQELPAYIRGWEVALMPFALNESTEFISPTKTPEYLAAGKPVVSTPVRDVVKPYGEAKLVHIACTPEEFVSGVEAAMAQASDPAWHCDVNAFLAGRSWDNTWRGMVQLMSQALQHQTA